MMSRIDPSVSKDMAAIASKKGAVFMDAPVSGGKQKCRPVLRVWRLGSTQIT